MRRTLTIGLSFLTALPLTSVSAQSRHVTRGALIGGIAGAVAVGLIGGIMSQGICDAADCSGAWVDGAVPGAAIGGLGGASLGALIGALIKGDAGSEPNARSRREVAAVIDASIARAEAEFIEQDVAKLRIMAGPPLGFIVRPSVEQLTGVSAGPPDDTWRTHAQLAITSRR